MRHPLTALVLPLSMCFFMLPGLAWAQPKAPSEEDLVAALLTGNESQLRRIGERMGAYKIGKLMMSQQRLSAIAAAVSVSHIQEGYEFLPFLGQAAARPDHSIAARAAEIAEALSSAISLGELEEQELGNHELSLWQMQWSAIASDSQRWMDIRVLSLETAAHLHTLQSADKRAELDWEEFLADKSPTMRSAALVLLPQSTQFTSLVVALLQSDKSTAVAMRSAQWLCGPLSGDRDPQPNLDEQSMGRVLGLAGNKRIDISRRTDLLACLQGRDKASKKAVRSILQQSPPALRRATQARLRKP
ncbi:MAG: hypothetical protein JKY56_06560 [Kofleriaceae bacterium]|nr:hypothetical protein [Kofleriaceae bacterium]